MILCHISPQKTDPAQERTMGYKKPEKTISFAELSLLSSLENNRSVKMMEQIDKAAVISHIILNDFP
jgi:hypothetical protein